MPEIIMSHDHNVHQIMCHGDRGQAHGVCRRSVLADKLVLVSVLPEETIFKLSSLPRPLFTFLPKSACVGFMF
jgi:hypothetical protein